MVHRMVTTSAVHIKLIMEIFLVLLAQVFSLGVFTVKVAVLVAAICFTRKFWRKS